MATGAVAVTTVGTVAVTTVGTVANVNIYSSGCTLKVRGNPSFR